MGECSTQLKRKETQKVEIGVRIGKLIIGNGGSGVDKIWSGSGSTTICSEVMNSHDWDLKFQRFYHFIFLWAV